MKKFYELFGHSPFIPIMEHMETAKKTVDLLPGFMEKYLAEDFDAAKEIFKQICKMEHEADVIKKEIRNHMPKTFLMPVARADILNFLKQQDNIADAAEDIVALCSLRKTRLPKELHKPLMETLQKNMEAVKIAYTISQKITELTNSGFSGKSADKVMSLIEKVEHLEWQCDKAQMSFAKKMFAQEKKMNPVDVMMWFNILRAVSKLSNAAESTGTHMRIMLSKR